MIEEEASKKPTLSPEGIIRATGEDKKSSHQTFTLADPIPDNLMVEDGLVMTSCSRAWYHMDQEDKKIVSTFPIYKTGYDVREGENWCIGDYKHPLKEESRL